MTRIISLTIIFICLLLNKSLSETNIFIYASIDNEVITNHDIKKESLYLKILNPNLEQINEDKILDLAKVSLINEIIKKKEILKLIDLNQENPFVDDYLKNLYEKPQEVVTLERVQRWAAVQVAKVFLGIPVIPGK